MQPDHQQSLPTTTMALPSKDHSKIAAGGRSADVVAEYCPEPLPAEYVLPPPRRVRRPHAEGSGQPGAEPVLASSVAVAVLKTHHRHLKQAARILIERGIIDQTDPLNL